MGRCLIHLLLAGFSWLAVFFSILFFTFRHDMTSTMHFVALIPSSLLPPAPSSRLCIDLFVLVSLGIEAFAEYYLFSDWDRFMIFYWSVI